MSDENDETENFIENISNVSENWAGKSMGPAEILEEWHLYGPARRSAALDDLDRKMKSIDQMTDLRKVSDLITLHGEMKAAHRRLRDAGR